MSYKSLISAIILILVLAGLSVYAMLQAFDAQQRAMEAETKAQNAHHLSKLLRLAAIVNHNLSNDYPGLQDQFQKAVHLRNMVYRSIPLKHTPNGFDYFDFDQSYLSSMRDDAVGHQCGGIAKIYALALESQGIPARFVGIVSDVKEPYDSHDTIEFWYQGKWHASDPTFNVMFMNDGQYLSYSQLYERVKQGQPYQVVTNDFSTLPGRVFAEYYIKPPDLMKYMVVHPARVWSGDKITEYPMELHPPTWNGTILFKDGQRLQVIHFSGIYEYLNKGPLR